MSASVQAIYMTEVLRSTVHTNLKIVFINISLKFLFCIKKNDSRVKFPKIELGSRRSINKLSGSHSTSHPQTQ